MARRKAQLGLSVTDGGALIPIGKNMFLAQGRTHAQGGIGLTFGKNYNPKGDLEIEKDELVQIVGGDNVKFNGNNKFKGGGQEASIRVFSSVPLLRGVSPAQLVLQGYNPDDVFKAQEEFKDRNRINDDGTKYETGGLKLYKAAPKQKPTWSDFLYNLMFAGTTFEKSKPKPVTLTSEVADKPVQQQYIVKNDATRIAKPIIQNEVSEDKARQLLEYYGATPYYPSLEIIDFIKNKEGFKSKLYDDGKGVPTIGYGFTEKTPNGKNILKQWKNKEMTKDEANSIMNEAIRGYLPSFIKATPNFHSLNNNQRDALFSYYYNIGHGNYTRNSPALQEALRNKDYEAVTNNIDFDYNNENFGGAKIRRDEERAWFNKKAGGIYIKPSKRGTFTAAAKKRGMDVQEFASKVLTNKEDYSPAMIKKANFAINASRWKKEYGGDDTKTAALKRLKNRFTIAGNYGGGMFGGAGAGSVIMEQPEYINDTITKRYLVPITQTFNDAFRNARNSGQNEFMFDGKLYNTNLGDNPNNNTAGASRTSTIIIPIEHKEVRRRKKEFGGNMIYTINGNVKNGLMSARPKAQYGKVDRKNKDVKVGPDGLIYRRAADGEWYTDGTKHVTVKPVKESNAINQGSAKAANKDKLKTLPVTRTYIGWNNDEEEKETKKIGSLTYEKNENGQWVPSSNQSITTTRSGGRPESFGMTRIGVNHPSGKYKYNPITGERLTEDGAVETSEPSVKGTTKVSSSSGTTPRKEGTKSTSSKAAVSSKPSKKGADAKYGTPLAERKESLYMTGIKNNVVTPIRAGMEKIKSPYPTGGGKQSGDGRWIGQYKPVTTADWIGLGSNLAGTVASYFMTKNAINKMPDPIKPIMAQAAKLKTRYNVKPQLTNIREAEQMNRAAVRRNTQSSNTSLAREQRLMNEARGARNVLYGQKENIETQLINQDRLNRQTVNAQNVATYNDYLTRLYAGKVSQNQLGISNINNLLSGLTGSINNILGTIESRRATNNTLRAIAAANPNVDARLIGGFDYYIDPITKRKYNKNQQYVGTING